MTKLSLVRHNYVTSEVTLVIRTFFVCAARASQRWRPEALSLSAVRRVFLRKARLLCERSPLRAARNLHAQYVFISFRSTCGGIDRPRRALFGQSAAIRVTGRVSSRATAGSVVRVCDSRYRSASAQQTALPYIPRRGGGASPGFRRLSAWRARVSVGDGPGGPAQSARAARETDPPESRPKPARCPRRTAVM